MKNRFNQCINFAFLKICHQSVISQGSYYLNEDFQNAPQNSFNTRNSYQSDIYAKLKQHKTPDPSIVLQNGIKYQSLIIFTHTLKKCSIKDIEMFNFAFISTLVLSMSLLLSL